MTNLKSIFFAAFVFLLSFNTYADEPLTFDFGSIQTSDALQLIADYANKNIVVADDVSGAISLRMKDVTWEQALDYVVLRKQLHQFESDGVIFVSRNKDYFSGDETAQGYGSGGSHSPKKKVVYPMSLHKVRYITAAEAIKGFPLAQGDDGVETLQLNEQANVIVARLAPERVAELRQYLSMIDVIRRQVMIEARIVEVDTSYTKSLGVNWRGSIGIGDVTAAVNSQLSAISNAVSTGGLTFVSGGNLLDARLAAMEAHGKGKIISQPRVYTADREQARIGRGTEVPYQQSAGDGATSVSFKEASLALDVTPVIDDTGAFLSIKLSKDEPDYASAVDGVPPIKTASVTSRVRLKMGETVALGGVYSNAYGDQIKRVPGLSRLPWIGSWFQYRSHSDTNSELILFLTIREA
ncbi:MAG: type IV pilus protein [Inoviridae sp.]|nr:MAG: type IV pilus protein [Inoviridae sp.]